MITYDDEWSIDLKSIMNSIRRAPTAHLSASQWHRGGFGAYELSSEVRRAAEYKLNLFGNRVG